MRGSEISARHSGNTRPMQQTLREVVAVPAVSADVKIHVESAIGLDGYVQPQAFQLGEQVISPLLEGQPTFFVDRQHLRLEAADGGVLRQARSADAQVGS